MITTTGTTAVMFLITATIITGITGTVLIGIIGIQVITGLWIGVL